MQIYASYKKRLDRAIQGVLIWSLKSSVAIPYDTRYGGLGDFLRPIGPPLHQYGGRRSLVRSSRRRRFFRDFKSHSISRNFRYVTIIALHALEHGLKGSVDNRDDDISANHWAWNELLEAYKPSAKVHEDDDEFTVLQYLDALCWQNLQRHLPGPSRNSNLPDSMKMDDLERRARRAIARESTTRGKSDQYNFEDRQLDSFSFLFSEIFPQLENTLMEPTLQRLGRRVSTTSFKPGVSSEETHSTMPISTEAPWELDCGNHQVTLMVAMRGLDFHEIRRAKELCNRFFSRDFILITSYSRSEGHAFLQFWNTTTSSIVCATFLDLIWRFQGKYIIIKRQV